MFTNNGKFRGNYWFYVLSVAGLFVVNTDACANASKLLGNLKDVKTTSPVIGKGITIGSLRTASPDGLSKKNAVIVKATNDMAGVDEVYNWLDKHYPGYTLINQASSGDEDRKFDQMTIKTVTGKEMTIWFDITASFGKF